MRGQQARAYRLIKPPAISLEPSGRGPSDGSDCVSKRPRLIDAVVVAGVLRISESKTTFGRTATSALVIDDPDELELLEAQGPNV